jgi:hypothetical protein
MASAAKTAIANTTITSMVCDRGWSPRFMSEAAGYFGAFGGVAGGVAGADAGAPAGAGVLAGA